MQLSISLILDVILIILVLLVAFNGKRQGLLAALLSFGGTVAGLLGAIWAARQWAPVVYEKFIGVQIGKQIETAIASALAQNGGDINTALQGLDFLPEATLTQITTALQGIGAGAATDIVPQIVAALQPVILPLLQVILFIVVSLLIRWAFKLLAYLLRGVNGVPLLGGVNKVLGFAFGFVTGIIDCWLICLALWLVATVAAGHIPYLTTAALDKSVLYSAFAGFNPFLMH